MLLFGLTIQEPAVCEWLIVELSVKQVNIDTHLDLGDTLNNTTSMDDQNKGMIAYRHSQKCSFNIVILFFRKVSDSLFQ